jgi:hypothetical protein
VEHAALNGHLEDAPLMEVLTKAICVTSGNQRTPAHKAGHNNCETHPAKTESVQCTLALKSDSTTTYAVHRHRTSLRGGNET